MSDESNRDRGLANDGKATAPLPGHAADDARSTVPLTPRADDARATRPSPGSESETVPPSGPNTPSLPKKLGRFEVRSWLGSGAFGDVYLAYDPQLDRPVALKVARLGALGTPERVARFLREAKAAANLRHPNIVPLYETGHEGGELFIASAFVPGRTLETVIQEANDAGNPLPLDSAARIARKLADALAYAHSQGVVHRDVKPANVIVDAAGEPHLLDFGLATREEAGGERLTQDGQGLGTPAYMAPEQADGSGVAASDQYSLGCALYEMTTGRTPFAGGPAQQVFLHRTQHAPPPRKLRRGVPRDLDTVILKCLEKEPARRYAGCAELAEDLRRFLDREPVGARRIGPAERLTRWAARNPVVASSVSFGMLALLVGTFVALGQAQEARLQAKAAGESALKESAQRKVAEEKTDQAVRATKRADDETLKAKAQAEKSRRLLDLSRVREADTARANGLLPAARDNLRAVAPENRCLAWGLIAHQVDRSPLVLYGHTGWVTAVAFSPDGSQILTASGDGTVRLWDASTGQPIAEWTGQRSPQYSRDGRQVLTESLNGVRIWDARSGRLLNDIKTPRTGSLRVAFLPDGRALTIVSQRARPGRIRILDTETGRQIAELNADKEQAHPSILSPDGRKMLTATGGRARVWDLASGRHLASLEGAVEASLSLQWTPDSLHLINETKEPVREGGFFTQTAVWSASDGKIVASLRTPSGSTPRAVGPDGSLAVTGNYSGNAWVWELRTGRVVSELRGHVSPVQCAAFSPDGRRVITGLSDGTARIWDARTGQPLTELRGHSGWVRSVAFSPDGRRVVTGGDDRTVRVWDAESGLPFTALGEHPAGVMCVAANADGLVLTSAGELYGRTVHIRIWEAATGRTVAELRGHNGTALCAAFSPDGRRVATGSSDKTARVWDARTGELLATMTGGHRQPVCGIAWSRDGRRLLTGADDMMVRVWDAATGEPIGEARDQLSKVLSVVLTPDGSRIVAAKRNGKLRVTDAVTGQLVREFAAKCEGAMALDPAGTRAATGSMTEGTVLVWDLATGQRLVALEGHTRPIRSLAWSPDGRRLVSGSEDGAVRVWDAETGQTLAELKGHVGTVWGVAVSPDGRRVVTGSGDRTARVWETGRPLHELRGPGSHVSCVAASADGTRVVTGSSDRTARVWDTATGETLAELQGHNDYVGVVAISADGSRVVTGSGDRTARVWDARTGQLLTELKDHETWVSAVAISPDGRRVVTASHALARVWDADSGALLAELKGHSGTVSGAAFSPGGERVFTWDMDGTARVWSVATGKRLLNEPAPGLPSPACRLPDGRLAIPSGNRVLLVDPPTIEALSRWRRWARPDPNWHALQQQEAQKANDPFAAAVHRALKTRALGSLAVENWATPEAWSYLTALARLNLRQPDLAPPPREVFRSIPPAGP